MIELIFTKENIAFWGFFVLLVWKIIDLIVKIFERKYYKIDDLAFRIAKEELGRSGYHSSFLPHFINSRNFLKTGLIF